jgi:hypothetical protein
MAKKTTPIAKIPHPTDETVIVMIGVVLLASSANINLHNRPNAMTPLPIIEKNRPI